jgi:hypothetical protein
MMINDAGEVVPMPAKNKKCPCKSKKNYKNCPCYIKDLERKTEFINRITKKLDETRPKQ